MTQKLIPASAVEDKLNAIREEQNDLRLQIDEIKQQIYELIQLEEMYQSVLEMAVEPEPGAPKPPAPPERLPPSDAVIALVGQSPGISRQDVIDRLENRIESDSDDKRHLLRNTIYGLAKREKLLRTEDDKLFLPGQGPGSLNGKTGPESDDREG